MADKDDDSTSSPWLKGVRGVKGIVPPGRRLSPKTERRTTRWSASGVQGVTPPGGHGPKDGPSVEWAKRDAERKAKIAKANERAMQAAQKGQDVDYDPMRPMAGFVPGVFEGLDDPNNLDALLREINEMIASNPPDRATSMHVAEMITQSKAPFEIIVAFAVLSAATNADDDLRAELAPSLERGAKVFFNMARRFDPRVKIPRGLSPQSVDSIFFDLPSTAQSIPYAFATHAFVRITDLLLRDDDAYDDALMAFASKMYERFIGQRSFGDESLARMFPWSPGT